MNLINRHMLVAGRIFILLFLAANSGFTMVLSYCTMDACCQAASQDALFGCRTMGVPHSTGSAAISKSNSCHSLTIAGGLKTDPSVLHNDGSTKLVKTDIAAQGAYLCFCSPATMAGPRATYDLFSHTPPHQVEKYVLNSSFLI